eukprot:g60767.t1
MSGFVSDVLVNFVKPFSLQTQKRHMNDTDGLHHFIAWEGLSLFSQCILHFVPHLIMDGDGGQWDKAVLKASKVLLSGLVLGGGFGLVWKYSTENQQLKKLKSAEKIRLKELFFRLNRKAAEHEVKGGLLVTMVGALDSDKPLSPQVLKEQKAVWSRVTERDTFAVSVRVLRQIFGFSSDKKESFPRTEILASNSVFLTEQVKGVTKVYLPYLGDFDFSDERILTKGESVKHEICTMEEAYNRLKAYESLLRTTTTEEIIPCKEEVTVVGHVSLNSDGVPEFFNKDGQDVVISKKSYDSIVADQAQTTNTWFWALVGFGAVVVGCAALVGYQHLRAARTRQEEERVRNDVRLMRQAAKRRVKQKVHKRGKSGRKGAPLRGASRGREGKRAVADDDCSDSDASDDDLKGKCAVCY